MPGDNKVKRSIKARSRNFGSVEKLKKYKNDKRTRERRLKRIRERSEDKTCYGCRKKGHDVRNCPEIKADDKNKAEFYNKKVCYKCGSNLHTLYNCKKWIRNRKDDDLPYASCFICKTVGHLAIKCSKNDHGLYPNGGSCRLCNSKMHLASDCKLSVGSKIDKGLGITILGETDLTQGADDDDFHTALMNRKEEVPSEKDKQKKLVKKKKKVVTM